MLKAMSDEQESKPSGGTPDRSASDYEATFVDRHSRTMKDAALRHIDRPVRGAVLDVGCGSGTMLATMAGENAALRLAGIDTDLETIRRAQQRLGARADLRAGDARELPWEDRRFDLVTCVNSFHRYRQPRRVLAEVHRVLKPGGTLVIADLWAPFLVRQLMNVLEVLRHRGERAIYGQREMIWMLAEEGFETPTWIKEGSFGFVATATVAHEAPGTTLVERTG
jgi:ubiquinone/menaquinone biosynthesis C-methylase UbiE